MILPCSEALFDSCKQKGIGSAAEIHPRATQNKTRGMLTSEIVLVHDNASPHSADGIQWLLQQFQWDVYDHPQYSPNLGPNDSSFPGTWL